MKTEKIHHRWAFPGSWKWLCWYQTQWTGLETRTGPTDKDAALKRMKGPVCQVDVTITNVRSGEREIYSCKQLY